MKPQDKANQPMTLDQFLAHYQIPERFQPLFSYPEETPADAARMRIQALEEMKRLQGYEKDDTTISNSLLTAINKAVGLQGVKGLVSNPAAFHALKRQEVDNDIAIEAAEQVTACHDYQEGYNFTLLDANEHADEALKELITKQYHDLPPVSKIGEKSYEGMYASASYKEAKPWVTGK